MSSARSGELARELRMLREQAGLTQAQLAEAFSRESKVSGPTISTWESETSPKTPTPARIAAYARFFATPRSWADTPTLLPVDELTDAEIAERRALETRLLAHLENSASADEGLRSSLTFREGPVTLVCPEVPRAERGALADPADPNFTRAQQYADLDTLIEVFGHVRKCNPELLVTFRLPSEVRADHLSSHVVVIGGIAWNPTTRRIQSAITEVPVTQVDDPAVEAGEIFTAGGQRFLPVWDEPAEPGARPLLAEDVGYLARLPNPFNSNRTLTICNGVHSRGVYGAARVLTDDRLNHTNEQYLADRFPDGRFAMLLRVPVVDGEAMTPDLQNPDVRLYEWPSRNGGPR
jgi:transcriptional regulator with XRE-family HTH domain